MKCLLIIDMQNEFVKGRFKSDAACQIVPSIRNLLKVARKSKIPVIYTADSHLPSDPELKIWGQHAMKGSKGAKIISELTPRRGDRVVEKRTYDAFYETNLDNILKGFSVKKVYICGILTDICVRHTVASAFFRGYQLIIAKDATAALKEEAHFKTLNYMEKVYGAKIRSTDEIVKELE